MTSLGLSPKLQPKGNLQHICEGISSPSTCIKIWWLPFNLISNIFIIYLILGLSKSPVRNPSRIKLLAQPKEVCCKRSKTEKLKRRRLVWTSVFLIEDRQWQWLWCTHRSNASSAISLSVTTSTALSFLRTTHLSVSITLCW